MLGKRFSKLPFSFVGKCDKYETFLMKKDVFV